VPLYYNFMFQLFLLEKLTHLFIYIVYMYHREIFNFKCLLIMMMKN